MQTIATVNGMIICRVSAGTERPTHPETRRARLVEEDHRQRRRKGGPERDQAEAEADQRAERAEVAERLGAEEAREGVLLELPVDVVLCDIQPGATRS